MTPQTALRVLIVDDEPIVADTLAVIAETRGHIARAAFSAEEAAQIADELMPHACISDVMMPGMNGFEFADWLSVHHPLCRVLLISGAVEAAALLEQRTPHSRRHAILAKPVSPAEVLTFLAACQSARVDTAQKS